jgi:hypothetical protein
MKETDDLFLCLLDSIRPQRLNPNHPDHPRKSHSKELLLRNRQRDKDDIILILSPSRLAFGGKDTYDDTRDLLDSDDLTDRVNSSKKVFRHSLAEDTNLGGVAYVLV